jgi:D-beta-D-heptose 7-phosphate kinase/D-beta-D-heptose 1-phosphate adenosyltransferase
MMDKLIWINGCFDILHYGHFQLIRYAAGLGNRLIIGIDSDNRVKELKGQNRPFHTQDQRKYNLSQIVGVYDVIVFNTEDELRGHLKRLKPDIFVIGSDYINKPIIGGEWAKEIKFFSRVCGFSTTEILDDA